MPFQKDNLNKIAAGGSSRAPSVYSYESTVDTIADIMQSNYFGYSTDYPNPLGLTQLMKTGDVINVVDKNGLAFCLNAVNTANVITMSSNNLIVYQESLDCTGVNTAQVFDRPVAGYVLKANAIVTGTPNLSSTPTIYIGKGLTNPIANFVINPNSMQASYDFTFTSNDRVFNGVGSDVTQIMRMFAVITGSTGTFSVRYNISIIPAVQ